MKGIGRLARQRAGSFPAGGPGQRGLRRLPIVPTPSETRAPLNEPGGTAGFIGFMLPRTGMRVLEGERLRVQDVGFERREIVVRAGKGGIDRVTVLPENRVLPLQQQMSKAEAFHDKDLLGGFGEV